MSDPLPSRLAELQRQRDLVADHLAWLDAQLASARQDAASTAPATLPPTSPVAAVFASPAPVVAAVPVMPPSASLTATAAPEVADDIRTAADAAAERILAEYRAGRSDPRSETRRGCLLYLGILFIFVGSVAAAWWLLKTP